MSPIDTSRCPAHAPCLLVQSTRESPPPPLFQNRTCDFRRILAPLSESLCHRHQFPGLECEVLCQSDLAHKHGATRCVESPARPANKALLLMAPSDFSIVLDPFLLSDSAHVSLSWALPQAFAFWAILTLVALVGTDSYNESVIYHYSRANQGFPRSASSFVAALGLCYTPSYFCVNMSDTANRSSS